MKTRLTTHILWMVIMGFICCHATVLFGQVTPDMASQAYRDQKYKESIDLYEQLISAANAENKESAELYYNVANAYFRNGQVGKAILNYERAHLLDPSDKDIAHNLRFAQLRTTDRIEQSANATISKWIESVANTMSSNAWAKLAVALFFGFAICIGLFLFWNQRIVKQISFYTAIPVLLLFVISLVFANYQKQKLVNRNKAIVIPSAIAVTASPDVNSSQLFELHEGTKVVLKNSDGEWNEVEIENGSTGWTLSKNTERI